MSETKRLVVQGYSKQEDINFIETFARIAILEAIQILLSFVAKYSIKFFQTDVESVFLNNFINEEVYVKQPMGFEDEKFPEHVSSLKRHYMVLHKFLGAWYKRLNPF